MDPRPGGLCPSRRHAGRRFVGGTAGGTYLVGVVVPEPYAGGLHAPHIRSYIQCSAMTFTRLCMRARARGRGVEGRGGK